MLEKNEFDFDYEKVAIVCNVDCVILSWLMELTEIAFFEISKFGRNERDYAFFR